MKKNSAAEDLAKLAPLIDDAAMIAMRLKDKFTDKKKSAGLSPTAIGLLAGGIPGAAAGSYLGYHAGGPEHRVLGTTLGGLGGLAIGGKIGGGIGSTIEGAAERARILADSKAKVDSIHRFRDSIRNNPSLSPDEILARLKAHMAGSTSTKGVIDMPPGSLSKTSMAFLKQDRPAKVKEIYSALKRDHPDMPAEMKARIAARQGKPGKQHQGPPYKGPLSKTSSLQSFGAKAGRAASKGLAEIALGGAFGLGLGSVEKIIEKATEHKPVRRRKQEGKTVQSSANLDLALGALYSEYGPSQTKHAAKDFYGNLFKEDLAKEALGAQFCKLASLSGLDPWVMALNVARNFEEITKTASTGSAEAQELGQFYLEWADGILKKAGLPGAGLVSRYQA